MADSATIAFGWERTALAVEKVRDRLKRASAALGQAGVAYAVVGGNAVAEWVGRMDEAAVRNTRDVDIMIRRSDLDAAKLALEAAGFVYCQVMDVDMFLDGPTGRPKDAVHIIFAGEKVRAEYATPSPDIAESEPAAGGSRAGDLRRERAADLPVMAERIDHSTESPPVGLRHREDLDQCARHFTVGCCAVQWSC